MTQVTEVETETPPLSWADKNLPTRKRKRKEAQKLEIQTLAQPDEDEATDEVTSAHTAADLAKLGIERAAELGKRSEGKRISEAKFLTIPYAVAKRYSDPATRADVKNEPQFSKIKTDKVHHGAAKAFFDAEYATSGGGKTAISEMGIALWYADMKGYPVETFIERMMEKEEIDGKAVGGMDKLVKLGRKLKNAMKGEGENPEEKAANLTKYVLDWADTLPTPPSITDEAGPALALIVDGQVVHVFESADIYAIHSLVRKEQKANPDPTAESTFDRNAQAELDAEFDQKDESEADESEADTSETDESETD